MECFAVLQAARIVPDGKQGDAMQLALSTIHRIDYLLTWNHAHLANVDTQRRLEELTRRFAWREPVIVSPETIPRVALGQEIRRRDNG
jgi:hypothetical protein